MCLWLAAHLSLTSWGLLPAHGNCLLQGAAHLQSLGDVLIQNTCPEQWAESSCVLYHILPVSLPQSCDTGTIPVNLLQAHLYPTAYFPTAISESTSLTHTHSVLGFFLNFNIYPVLSFSLVLYTNFGPTPHHCLPRKYLFMI